MSTALMSVALEDMTVELSQEEWWHMGPAQGTLYRDVMLEIYSHLVSVGKGVVHHNVAVRTLVHEVPKACHAVFADGTECAPGNSFGYKPMAVGDMELSPEAGHAAVGRWSFPSGHLGLFSRRRRRMERDLVLLWLREPKDFFQS